MNLNVIRLDLCILSSCLIARLYSNSEVIYEIPLGSIGNDIATGGSHRFGVISRVLYWLRGSNYRLLVAFYLGGL